MQPFHLCLLSLCHLVLASCESVNCSPSSSVKSAQVIAIAESYRTHEWAASASHVKHGADCDGVVVNTPDVSLEKGRASKEGWWVPGTMNVGIPYKWGGFDSPKSFDIGLRGKAFAGDVYTRGKEAAVSKQARGVDCSGFVSRCWRLERHYSTRELPSLCRELDSMDELQAGDILNKYDEHVVLFKEWTDETKRSFMAYETGCEQSWKVTCHKVYVRPISRLGYKPLRYKGIKHGEAR